MSQSFLEPVLNKPLMITTWALAFLITHPGLTESHKAQEWSGADGTKTGQFLAKDALWTQQLMQPLLLQPVVIVVGEEERRDGTPKQGHHHRRRHRWSHGPQAMWEELSVESSSVTPAPWLWPRIRHIIKHFIRKTRSANGWWWFGHRPESM